MNSILTLGMATYDDAPRLWHTVQTLRITHADVMPLVEIFIADNNPDGKHGEQVRGLCDKMRNAGQLVRYMPIPHPVGTSAPRDRIFREAAGQFVLVMDSHVHLDSRPGSPHVLRRLLDWINHHPDSRDLISGPMLYDGLDTLATHFND